LKLDDRIKELLEEKNRLKVDVRVVYEKNELQPAEINWLRTLTSIRTSYSRNLRAKCYLNEQFGIITSLNLWSSTQGNPHEMGLLISRAEEPELFANAVEEAQRIIRVSEEVRMSFEKVQRYDEEGDARDESGLEAETKFSTSKLARKLGLKTQELTDHLVHLGAIEIRDGEKQITSLGRRLGGELRVSPRFGRYFLWPQALPLTKSSV
jgi:hypothetical protein